MNDDLIIKKMTDDLVKISDAIDEKNHYIKELERRVKHLTFGKTGRELQIAGLFDEVKALKAQLAERDKEDMVESVSNELFNWDNLKPWMAFRFNNGGCIIYDVRKRMEEEPRMKDYLTRESKHDLVESVEK